MADPLGELIEGLCTSGRPPLPWAIRWSAAGGEPMAAAWAATERPLGMLRLLGALGHDLGTAACVEAIRACRLGRATTARMVRAVERDFAMYGRAGQLPPGVGHAIHEAIERRDATAAQVCTAIRRVVPTLPALGAVVTSGAGLR